MTELGSSIHRFFAELKRRKVFRVMAVYGVVAFGALQFADLSFPLLGLPEWTITLVLALSLVGFPIALVLAWAFELTPEGVKKTEDAAPGELTEIIAAPARARWPAGILALVGVAALVWGAWLVGKRAGVSEVETASSDAAAAAAPTGVQLAYAEMSEDPRPSIAVLPFDDMSPERDQEYFTDGMTEEILGVLAKIPDIRVAARTTAFAYKGQDPDLREVGADLGVRYILEGSVRKAGDDLRITAQLIDTRDNFHVWAESYDRKLDNVFQIQSEIAEAIAEALKVPLGLEESSRLVAPTADLTAYDLYLEGRARMRERGSSVEEAVTLFEAAIVRDSAWAPAWAGLANAQTLRPFYLAYADDPPDEQIALWEESLTAAEASARRALDLDPDNSLARVALGSVYRDRWQWEEAEVEYRRALAVDPDNVEAHHQYAEMLWTVGRPDEGMLSAARAVALDRSPIYLAMYAWNVLANGRNEEAIDIAREGIALDPGNNLRYLRDLLFLAYMKTGRYDELTTLSFPGSTRPDTTPRTADQAARDSAVQAEMIEMFVHVLKTGDLSVLPPGALADESPETWMLLGQPDSALARLEGYTTPVPYASQHAWIFDAAWDPYRDDPRVQALQAQLGLEGVEPSRPSRPED
jgi:TolB-like protein